MIELQNLSPKVYYKQSRDFQYLGRLFDLVLNQAKTSTELIYSLPISEDSPDDLLNLLALTLGFKPKHTYNNNQLRALCNCLNLCLKAKGSLVALNTAISAILNAESIKSEDFTWEYTKNGSDFDYNEINIFLPISLKDISLLLDLLDYILPAGMSCNIYKEASIKLDTIESSHTTADELTLYSNTTNNILAPVNSFNTGVITTIKTNPTDYKNALVADKAGLIVTADIIYDVNNKDLSVSSLTTKEVTTN